MQSYYSFTCCSNLGNEHYAERFSTQEKLDAYLNDGMHPTHVAETALSWYSPGDEMQEDVLYRSKKSLNEFCCSICVLKTSKQPERVGDDPNHFYGVPVDAEMWENFLNNYKCKK